jgi:hypothetical protein
MKTLSGLVVLVCFSFMAFAQPEVLVKIKGEKDKQFVTAELDKKFNTYKEVAKQILKPKAQHSFRRH